MGIGNPVLQITLDTENGILMCTFNVHCFQNHRKYRAVKQTMTKAWTVDQVQEADIVLEVEEGRPTEEES